MHHNTIKIAQELDLSFEGSTAVVIDSSIIQKYVKDIGDKKPVCYYDFKKKDGSFCEYVTSFHIWKKPTEDGIVTSLELFDKNGDLIVYFFGERKPGKPELKGWREIIDNVNLISKV